MPVRRNCFLCRKPFLTKKSRILVGHGRFCSVSCSRKSPLSTEERFWEKVKVGENTESCWPWIKSPTTPYGVFNLKGRNVSAHRYSWELRNGPIPAGFDVLHGCDIPKCVNPWHLYLGTDKENVADRVRRKRSSSKENGNHAWITHPEKMAKGERAHSAKLLPYMIPVIIEMREIYSFGKIARIVGISKKTAIEIYYRKTWKHLWDGEKLLV